MKHQRSLSIVIPAYNEENRIGSTLTALAEFLKSNLKDYKIEIIVVIANGSDDTIGVVRRHSKSFTKFDFQVLQPGPKAGKGRDVQYGMIRAKSQFKLFMDADMATPLHHISALVSALEDGADMVIGVRDINTIHSGFRSLLSRAGNLLSKLTVDVYHKDTQCGFKGFTAEATEICFERQEIHGWGFDIEILAIAKLHHLTIAEIPIYDWQDVKGGSLNENVAHAASRTLHELAIIRRNIKSKRYHPEVSFSESEAE